MRQIVLNFPFFSMQLKHADNTYSNINEPFSNPTKFLIQSGKQTLIHNKSQFNIENEVTVIIQPSLDSQDTDDLNICPALTTTKN